MRMTRNARRGPHRVHPGRAARTPGAAARLGGALLLTGVLLTAPLFEARGWAMPSPAALTTIGAAALLVALFGGRLSNAARGTDRGTDHATSRGWGRGVAVLCD